MSPVELPRMAVILFLLIIIQSFKLSLGVYFCEDECTNAISEGPSCFNTSPGVACLAEQQCNNITQQLKVFERYICESPYLPEFLHKPECWTETFKKCREVAVTVENHQDPEKACRGKSGAAHFCRVSLKSDPPHCRLPSRRLLYTILLQQGCGVPPEVKTYNGCGHYCEGNILRGPQCSRDRNESDGVNCLRQCPDPYLQRLSDHLQEFERVVCDNNIHKAFMKNPVCWLEIFHHCKEVASITLTDEVTNESCSKLDFHMRGCKHRLKKTQCYNYGTKVLSLMFSPNPCEPTSLPSLAAVNLPLSLLAVFATTLLGLSLFS